MKKQQQILVVQAVIAIISLFIILNKLTHTIHLDAIIYDINRIVITANLILLIIMRRKKRKLDNVK